MKLYIKNMVSIRCKMIVKSELEKLGLHYTTVDLGEVEVKENLTPDLHNQLYAALLKFGFELQTDMRSMLVEKIKLVIIEMVHYADTLPESNFSEYLTEKLKYDYTYLSNLFSTVHGNTIEQYIITHKIEKAKELLVYDELSLTQISRKLNYSSVSHLSNQFKKVTGLTPSYFKKLRNKRRIAHSP